MTDDLYVGSETGDFLNEEQKALKGKITEELISVMRTNIRENLVMLKLPESNQALSDIIMSSFIMFARETLKGFIGYQPIDLKEKVIDKILGIIKEECLHVEG